MPNGVSEWAKFGVYRPQEARCYPPISKEDRGAVPSAPAMCKADCKTLRRISSLQRCNGSWAITPPNGRGRAVTP